MSEPLDLFTILDQMGDAIVVLDSDCHIVGQNAVAEHISGRSAAEVIGATLQETWPAKIAAPLVRQLRGAMANRLPLQMEHRGFDASGQDVCWDVHILPIDPGLTIVVRDVSSRKRCEERAERLQQLTAALAAALDPEDVGAAIIEHAMPALGANAATVYARDNSHELKSIAARGYEPDVLERSRQLPMDGPAMMAEVVSTGHPIFLSTWKERLKRFPHHRGVHAGGGDRAVAGLPLRVEGRTIGALSLAFPTDRNFDVDDRRFMATVADLCAQALERARLYEAVRRSEAQVRRLFDAGVVGVIVTEAERIVEANNAFLEMVGYTRDELDSGLLNWVEMTPPEYAEVDARGIAEIEERGVSTPFEKACIRRDGSRVPILIGAAELERDPRLLICFVLDLTERKRAGDEWRAFVDTTAHDLRNPLTAVLGQTQLLLRRLRRDGGMSPTDGETKLAAIASSAMRATGLIDDLIDTARLQAGQPLELRPMPVDLVAMVMARVDEARRVGPSHVVRVEAQVAQMVVIADGPRIERVVRNVIDNAIIYSPSGGEIVVHVRREDDEAGSWAILAIEDPGMGIPAADLPYVFDRFRRGGNVAGRIAGSGIGLTGAQQIAAQHGGAIAVQSTEGEGSTFTLRLPLPA